MKCEICKKDKKFEELDIGHIIICKECVKARIDVLQKTGEQDE